MPPTLAELLIRTFLPAEGDDYYDAFTVEGSVPVCGEDDTRGRRILVDPENPNVYFPALEDISPTTTFLNVDDSLLRRILTATGGFVYEREGRGAGGASVPMGSGVLHLCRSESPVSGDDYELYIADNAIITNAPNNDAPLLRLPIVLHYEEISAIVHSNLLPDAHYQVDPSDHRYLNLMPETSELNRLIEFVEGEDSPISPDRRAPIAEALRAIRPHGEDFAREGLDLQRGMRSEMRWQMLGMGVLTAAVSVYSVMLASGKAGPIHRTLGTPFRGIYNLVRAPFDRGAGLRRFWQDMTSEVRYRGLSTVLGSGTNLTEMARRGEIRPAVDEGTATMIERIMNRISTPRRAGSAIVEAPPGWGKEVLMRNLALENQDIVFIQTQPDDLMSGTMYRGQLEEKLRNIPREIEAALQRGQRVVLCIDEFHEAITAGRSMEETRSLLERWKGPLANGTLRIVGFSTPDEMLKVRYQAGLYDSPESRTFLSERQRDLIRQWEADPERFHIRMSENIRPLLNRFRGFEAPVRTAEDMRAMVNDEIERMRTQDHINLRIEPRTIEMIVRLSESPVSGEGYIPRSAFDLFDGVIADAAERTDMNRPIEITHAAFEAYVRTSWPRVAQRFGLTAPSSSGPVLVADTPLPSGSAPRVVADTTGAAEEESGPRVVPEASSPPPAESILMAADAAPLDALNRDVIRAQIVLTYREYYMSQAGRDALRANRPLPTGDALIDSEYRSDVNDLVDMIVRRYANRGGAAGLAALWDAQRERGFIPRGGVPEGLLTEVCMERIEREHADGLSRYSGTRSPETFRREARTRLNNTESFERGLVEALREPARIGR